MHDQTLLRLNKAAKSLPRTPGIKIKGELNFLGHGHSRGMPKLVFVQPSVGPVQRSIKRCEPYAVK